MLLVLSCVAPRLSSLFSPVKTGVVLLHLRGWCSDGEGGVSCTCIWLCSDMARHGDRRSFLSRRSGGWEGARTKVGHLRRLRSVALCSFTECFAEG